MRAIGVHGTLLALLLAGGSVLGAVEPTRAGDTDEVATAPWVGARPASHEQAPLVPIPPQYSNSRNVCRRRDDLGKCPNSPDHVFLC